MLKCVAFGPPSGGCGVECVSEVLGFGVVALECLAGLLVAAGGGCGAFDGGAGGAVGVVIGIRAGGCGGVELLFDVVDALCEFGVGE